MRQTVRPLTAGDLHERPVRLLRAVQRFARCRGVSPRCMGLMSVFSIAPPPCVDFADNGLGAGMNMHMLDRHLLRAARPVSPVSYTHLTLPTNREV